MLFLKNLFPNLYGMANCFGGVGLGREGLHERHTRTPHRTHTQARRGRPGAEGGELAGPPPAGTSTPSHGEDGDPRSGGSPTTAQLCPVGARRPAISGGWRRGFCPSCPLGSGWLVGRKRAKEEPFPTRGRRSGIQTHDAKMQTHRQHTHTLTHTLTQFYLPLIAKIKLPSDTRSALRVSVQFNDD